MPHQERRKYPRVATSNIVSYVCIDKDDNEVDQGMGRAVNISQGGTLLETSRPIESEYILLLTVDLNDNVIQAKGEVIHTRPIEAGKYLTGIRFKGTREEVLQIVKSLIIDYHRQKNKTQSIIVKSN